MKATAMDIRNQAQARFMLTPTRNKTNLAASLWVLVVCAMCLFEPLQAIIFKPSFPLEFDYNQTELARLSLGFSSKYLLFKLLNRSNVIMSPITIHAMMTMLMEGTTPNGSMRQAMTKHLSLNGAHDPKAFSKFFHYIYGYTNGMLNKTEKPKDFDWLGMDIMNKILYTGKEINPEYHKEVTKKYLVFIEEVIMQPAFYTDMINYWARTRGFKSNLISAKSIPRQGRSELSMYTGVALRSTWEQQFEKSLSSEFFYNFHIETGTYREAEDVVVLRSRNHRAQLMKYSIDPTEDDWISLPIESEDYNFIGLRIPMKGHRETALTIFVPKSDSKESSPLQTLEWLAFENRTQRFVEIFDELSNSPKIDVDISMPAFRLEQTHQLKPFVQSLGLGALFTTDSQLTQFTVNELDKVKTVNTINGLFHSVSLQIEKRGATSASVSRSMTRDRSEPKAPKAIVDNPFLFFLTHDGVIMLAGRIMKLGSN